MSNEKIKSLFGKRLLTLLLVPAILGCNFTAIHASADETIAAIEAAKEEADAPAGDGAVENTNDEQNNENNDAQDQGDQSEEGSEENNEGGESDESSDNGEGSDNSEGASEGEGSEGDDAASTGASPEEGENNDAGDGASTGASSDNSGSDSSTDATSSDSSDSSDASSNASSEDSADAASSASSEDASDASSSASSDEWEDEDVSENSEGDVSDNDAEDEEEYAEFTVLEIFDDFEISIVYNYTGNDITSTDICIPEDCIINSSWELYGVSVNGNPSRLFFAPSVIEEKISNAGYYIYHSDKYVEANKIFVSAKHMGIYCGYGRNRKVYHKKETVAKLEDYYPYPASCVDVPEGYNNTEIFYINTSGLVADSFEFSVSYLNPSEHANIKAKFKDDDEWGDYLHIIRIEDLDGNVINSGEDLADVMPLMPLKCIYKIVPKKTGSLKMHLQAQTDGPSTYCFIDAEYPSGSGNKKSYNKVFVDGKPPVVEFLTATSKNEEDTSDVNTLSTDCITTGEKFSISVEATDEHIRDISTLTYSFKGNNGKQLSEVSIPFPDDGKSEITGVEGCPKKMTAEISFSEPGKYTFHYATAKDYAENESSKGDKDYSVVYSPGTPKLILGNCQPAGETEGDQKIFEYGTEVTMDVTLTGAIFFNGGDFDKKVKAVIDATCNPECGDGQGTANYDYSVTDVSYGNGTYSAKLRFKGTGKYVVSVKNGTITDDCGREIVVEGKGETFTIEPEAPNAVKNTIQKSTPKNEIYYKDVVIESVVYDRKNVDKYVYIENNEVGLPTKTPRLEFATEGKNTVAKAVMDEDGRYSFRICYKRHKYSKPVVVEFDTYVIDRKAPEVTFAEVENFSANNGVVAPVINCSDENMDKQVTEIKLIGSNNGEVQIKNTVSEYDKGITIKCADFAREKKNDDLYTLEATVMDLAGNESKQTLVFSVNRFGSVFVLGEDTKAMNQKYYTNDPHDVTVTEINVDDLVTRDISVTRDGNMRRLNGETDYRVSRQGDDTSWKTYTYNVAKTNFEKDGVYSVSLYTVDRATNEMDNKSRNAEIEFAVDRTAPSIVVADIEDEGVYKEETHSFNVDVTDNMGLVSFTVYNNGKEVQEFTGKELEEDGNVETITLEESSNPQNITLIATDVAGNKQTVVFKDVLVSTKDINPSNTITDNNTEGTQTGDGNGTATTGGNELQGNGEGGDQSGETGEVHNDEFPYKTVGAVVVVVACVAAAGGAGFMIRRRKQKK